MQFVSPSSVASGYAQALDDVLHAAASVSTTVSHEKQSEAWSLSPDLLGNFQASQPFAPAEQAGTGAGRGKEKKRRKEYELPTSNDGTTSDFLRP